MHVACNKENEQKLESREFIRENKRIREMVLETAYERKGRERGEREIMLM